VQSSAGIPRDGDRRHAETAGGYAKELSEETHKKELAFLAGAAKDADIVITTAAIPGRRPRSSSPRPRCRDEAGIGDRRSRRETRRQLRA